MKLNNLKFVALIFALLLSINAITAQKKNTIPAPGNLMLELNFKPFGETIISFDQLKLKYKYTDHYAFRLGLAFNHSETGQTENDFADDYEYKGNMSENITSFSITPGIEYHFLNNSRISPYAGVELSYSNRNTKSHYTNYQSGN